MSSRTNLSFAFDNRVAASSIVRPGCDEAGEHQAVEGRDSFSLPGFNDLGTVDDLVVSLDLLGVPGPLTLSDNLMERNALGTGAQFGVHESGLLDASNNAQETYLESVAVKRGLFITEDGGSRLDLSSRKARRQIHDMYLEVVALRHEALRTHRNIVRLLGWSVEETFHNAPLLVVELALGHLRAMFEKAAPNVTSGTIQQLSIDIGQGLDAIHEAGIVHCDVKPENILVFENFATNFHENVPYIAKLADFGLSISEVKESMDDGVYINGMSTDWCAPEIRQGIKLSTSQLMKADTFSYGMVLASMSCYEGQAPKTKDRGAILEVLKAQEGIPDTFRSMLRTAVSRLLQQNAADRPMSVGMLLKDASVACKDWASDEAERRTELADSRDLSSTHPWSLPPLAAYFLLGLRSSFERYHERLTGPHMLAIFLAQSYSDVDKTDKVVPVKILRAAVQKGYTPAIAVLSRVLQSYGIEEGSDATLLFKGASSESLLAWHELMRLNAAFATQAWDSFRGSTGYNQYYSPVANLSLDTLSLRDFENNAEIHVHAARGEVIQLKNALGRGASTRINAKNAHGETALYKACLTGDWKTVEVLCKAGADASVPSDLNRLTCLHWLFNFPGPDVEKVAGALLAAGANINALAQPWPPIANPHFPFTWPPGSPLHFAVFASSKAAVITLLKHGASLTVRDGRDPYTIDDNVRQMHCHGDAEQGDWSEPDNPALGFTPIDLAAAMHDHEMLSCIRTNANGYDVTSVDEEGYTPLHRLSHLRLVKTARGLRFWHPAFTGTQSEVKDRMIKTIRKLQQMGGNINKLTSAPSLSGRSGVAGLTPLMIAVTNSDQTAVEALLGCGADANIANADGRTALTLLPEGIWLGEQSFLRIVKLLIHFRADVNHASRDYMTPLAAVTEAKCTAAFHLLVKSGADLTSTPDGLNIIARWMWISSYWRALEMPYSTADSSIKTATAQENEIVGVLGALDLKETPWASSMDKDGGTLLHYAAYSGLVACVRLLIAAKLDINRVRKMHFKRSSRRPASYNEIPALHMPEGTPLDVVEERHKKFVVDPRTRFSEGDARFVLTQFEEVETILREHGAVRSKDLLPPPGVVPGSGDDAVAGGEDRDR
ncbi:hypothetical protein LTR35_003682 [Friedmanniomyces endolithicus]|nr:hypothetical protein LTR35_003682 [Friedmanniomyces endolithicus]KAK0289835.1 hypothetical protein LTS00_008972 [Friedmanniomyces endolithicus]KAK1019381.1 hypothetical protein LTR54_000023 [Friedmanniomyces endolithicus]